MRTEPEQYETEAIFRIVYESLLTRNGYNLPARREQKVEVSLQHKENTENRETGILTRRTSLDQAERALPIPCTDPKLPKAFRIPRVVELLRMATTKNCIAEQELQKPWKCWISPRRSGKKFFA